ncbi:MAG: efflux RND transporter permease subunit [Gammaproteobacteria bacterium]|nr:efflux RND transporter permease subunit [Gammaproteobacteria bacterium]
MWLSDISVRRPVFATVISLLLAAIGLLSFMELQLREYPDVAEPVVSINTSYAGASADVIESQVTQVLESQIAGIEGIRSINSSSRDGQSQISIEFNLDRDIDTAANDVRDRVSRSLGRLPEDVDLPRVQKSDSDTQPIMWMNLSAEGMNEMELTDYASRYVVDRLEIIPGISGINLSGGGQPSMRIWLDRIALAARGLTVSDIEAALRRENVELPGGRVDAPVKEFTVRIARNYQTAEDFRRLVLTQGADGHLVRLGEVATVEVAPSELRQVFRTNGETTVGMGIIKQSTANTITVLEEVKRVVAEINRGLPEGMVLETSTDDSQFILAAIAAVYETILVTVTLVGLVTLLFLGSLRTMIIPLLTIPVCLLAAFIVIAAFGYTVNLITLLALVLSIGLVVDDSIVVLENVHRRIEGGEPPLLAAFQGTRQVAFAVIATTAVLVAVFAPIVFLKDDLGRIFSELAVTMSAALIFSALLALSLTPMLCSKVLRAKSRDGGLTHWLDIQFGRVAEAYARLLTRVIRWPWAAVAVTLGIGVAVFLEFERLPREYAPREDQGLVIGMFEAPEGTGFEYMRQFAPAIEAPMRPYIESGDIQRGLLRIPGWNSNQTNSAIAFINLAPWGVREASTQEVQQNLLAEWNKISSLRVNTQTPSGLSGGGGMPVEFVLGGPDYDTLASWRDIVVARAEAHPGFQRVDSDLRETQPQLIIQIDRDRAAALGVSVQSIGRTLATMMSERRVTTYVVDGEEYDVIMQAKDDQRASADDLLNIYVRADRGGDLVPLANLVKVVDRAGPARYNRYNRMRAVTISASLEPGFALGDALEFLEQTSRAELPDSLRIDWKGESLEYREATSQLAFTMGIALLIVFLVMAAQFESFIHPLVIMMTVPLAVAGGLFGLLVTGSTLNIYSQIGLLMLVGIATKNGILIVEFANQLRDEGMAFDEAIIAAARIRFRPILMTTMATVIGSVPLMLATGPASESRIVLGTVVFFGVSIAALLTLFVVPAFYRLFAQNTGSPNLITRRLEAMIRVENN